MGLGDYVDDLVAKLGRDRSRLIPILQEVQKTFRYLPREAVEGVAEKLGVPVSEVLNVATFYHQFRLEPIGRYVIYVCFGTACYLRGSEAVYNAMRLAAGVAEGRSTSEDGLITVEKARCFGCCSLAPVAMAVSADGRERVVHGKLTPLEARRVVATYRSKALAAGGVGAGPGGVKEAGLRG
jgi:NADH-quinone oxidoreductase subunit E